MRRTTALILGGGPAGAAAAIGLARAGASHLLLERHREVPDALCGGFLSWRSLATLARLGIEADDLNTQSIRRVRLFGENGRMAEARLPAPGRAVSRHRLDTLLLARAEAAGARVERGVTIKEVDGTRVRTADGAGIEASALFLASGKHDVRGAARPAAARGADPTLGLRLRLPPSPRLTREVADAVELHLFKGGYAGLALQEDGSANLCLAVHRSTIERNGSPAAFLQRLCGGGRLGDRLDGVPIPSNFDAVANVPYGWRAREGMPGRFRLGDQAGVIPSLAGEGMSIALASGESAARDYLSAGAMGSAAWQSRFAARLQRPIAIASAIRALAEGRGQHAVLGLAHVPGLIQVMAAMTRIGQAAA